MNSRRAIGCLLAAATVAGGALAPGAARAQPLPVPEPPAARPRVALVLSGGGALGLAHVGVLRVLEELHVPVDCVAGTSMGAIVGGLYAAGYSPAELEELALTLDWRSYIQDQPDRRDLPYRRKVDDLTYLTRWELGLSKKGIELPPGIVPGHRLGATLRILALRARGVEDFDRLPLPFRAVAADAATGETVVLDRGDLALALRASMAVPALFSPVENDGRLLVDGGVVANLPVDAARSMGAEVVIAVDVGRSLASRQRPTSATSILTQSLELLGRRQVERALAGVDVVVRPQVGEYKMLDFHAAPELLERGLAAAREQAEPLRRLAVDDETWQRYLERQRRTTPVTRLDTLVIDPGPGLAPAAVARAVRSRPGREIDPLLLAGDLERLWELGEFETVDFALRPADSGGWNLEISGRRKPWGPNFLRFGAALASDLEGTSSFNFLGALTRTRLDRLGGELKVAAQLGEIPVLTAELYQPLATSQVPFAALTLQGTQVKEQYLIGRDWVQYRFARQRVGLDLGLSFGRYGELRGGVRRDHTTGGPIGDHPEESPHYDLVDSGYHVALTYDQLAEVNFPRHGLLAFAELYDARESLGADEEYRRLDLSVVAPWSFGRHTLLGLLHGGTALGGSLPASNRLGVGGLFNLSGLPPGEVSGNYGGVAALVYLFRLGRLPNFGDGLYVGVSAEAGNLWERSSDVGTGDLRWSFAVAFGADTFVGPVYVAHGWTKGGKDSFYLYVGRSF